MACEKANNPEIVWGKWKKATQISKLEVWSGYTKDIFLWRYEYTNRLGVSVSRDSKTHV
jgi:hypothetical protein